MPACVLNLQNSDQEIIRCLDATDFSSLHQKFGGNKDIFVSDLLRRHEVIISVAGMMEDIMWFPLIKKQGRFWRSNVSSLKIFLNFLMPIFFFGMLGTRSYRSFPVWGRMEKDGLVQVVIPYELSLYEKGSTLTVPDELKR